MTRHSWDHNNAKRFLACESTDGNGRTERHCLNEGCEVVRVTVHGGDGKAWREWRTRDSLTSWQWKSTPPCLGKPAPTRPQVASESTAEVIAV